MAPVCVHPNPSVAIPSPNMKNKVIIEIKESGPSTIEGHFQTWPVKVTLTASEIQESLADTKVKVRPDDQVEISKYLNKILDQRVKEEEILKTEQRIKRYREELFDSLKLHAYLARFVGFTVEIHIRLDSDTKEDRSIQSIHWELLEDLDLWRQSCLLVTRRPLGVTIRRCVGVSPKLQKRTSQARDSGKVEVFSILLVVARRKLDNSEDYDPLNPTSVLFALLESQEELKSRGPHQRLHIEVVRPGCFEELEKHLDRWKSREEEGMYQIVHFDMHGDASADGAYLSFNMYDPANDQLITTDKSATDVAQLLRRFKLDCVVLSACKSASADEGISKNLSWNLVQSGIATVLAMSYNMPDSMSKIFYRRFYHEIFVKRTEFAHAATIARKQLVGDQNRWSYSRKKYMKLQDWFVPVVYSDGHPWNIERHPGLQPRAQAAFQDLLPSVCWFLFGIVITVLYHKYWLLHTNPCVSAFNAIIQTALAKPWEHILYLSMPLLASKTKRKIHKFLFFRFLSSINQDRKNILRIEGDLRRSRNITLSIANDVDKTAWRLLHVLTDIWQRTLLVEHRVIIQAEWFFRRVEGMHWMRSLINLLLLTWHNTSPGLKLLQPDAKYGARTVVVINNIDLLFPEPKNLKDYHHDAQERWREWQDTHLGAETESVMGMTFYKAASRYLILVVERPQEKTISWTNRELGEFAQTQYTDPKIFSHIPERHAKRLWLW